MMYKWGHPVATRHSDGGDYSAPPVCYVLLSSQKYDSLAVTSQLRVINGGATTLKREKLSRRIKEFAKIVFNRMHHASRHADFL
eukprot:5948124-Pleurochrysis_carterae.AAC.1